MIFVLILRIAVDDLAVDFESLSDNKKVEILLFGNSRCDDNKNNFMLSASINYIKKTKRFDYFLFDKNYFVPPTTS